MEPKLMPNAFKLQKEKLWTANTKLWKAITQKTIKGENGVQLTPD